MRSAHHAAVFLSSTALAIAAPAYGQSPQATPPPVTSSSADQSQDSDAIPDIIITAQKRSQRLQDVPAAVSAIDSAALAAKGITETSDLMGAIPSLQVTTPYGRTQPNFSLRGISVANEFSASTASPVGVYVDEVYQSFRASHGQQLYDIDRVEVLRGPQGTLYGRNTTGGAISFFTRTPGLDGDSGTLSVGYGNYNTWTAQGAVEATLIPDELGIRIAGTFADGDGWQYNPTQKRWVGTTNSVGGRVSLRWKPASNLDINAKAYIARDNPWGANAYGMGQLAQGRDALGYSRFDPAMNGGRALNDNEVASDTGGFLYTKSYGFALNIKYDVSDDLTLTSITGYDLGRYVNAPTDCDGSPNDLCSIRYDSRSRNFNQDLRLTYKNGPFNLIAGAYYGIDTVKTHNQPDFFGVLRPILLGAGLPGTYNNAAIGTPDAIGIIPAFAVPGSTLKPGDAGFCAPVTINPNGFLDARSLVALQTDIALDNSGGGGFGGAYSAACSAAGAPPFSPIFGDQRYTVQRPSKAIYADASYELTPQLTVSAGLRYTWDKVKFYDGVTTLLDLGGNNIVAGLIPYSFPYDPSLPAMRQNEKANRLTGRLNLSYKFTDNIMAYAQYSRGYRSGSFNGLAYQGTNQVYYIQPETVNAYEGGLKTMLFDRRVQLNLAGFYYGYKNQQFTQVVGATTFTRSGNGRLFGGEAELNVRAARGLNFNASLGLLNTKYTGNAMDPNNPASATLPINGNPFPNAPGVTGSVGFDWDVIDDGASKVTLSGDANYMGKYYFDPFKNYGQTPCNSPAPGFNILQAGPSIACGNPAYWLFNGRITYRRGNYSVSVWGKNLTDKFYYTYGLNISVFGLDYMNRGQPRTFGIEATAKF